MDSDTVKVVDSSSSDQPTHSRWDFLKRREQPVTVLDARRQLIDTIMTEGLHSSASLKQRGREYLGSIDRKTLPFIFGRILLPPDRYKHGATLQRALEHALYTSDNSVLPVITERPGESTVDRQLIKSTPTERDKISRRATGSFLVVCNASPNDDMTRTEDETTLDKFSYILMPQEVLDDYNVDTITGKGVRVKSVGTVERSLLRGDRVKVPDYEGALKDVIKELDTPVWIHGVRLPVEEDLQTTE